MDYTIIEDCSPYYVRFTWNGLSDVINFISQQSLDNSNIRKGSTYDHINFDVETANKIIKHLPMNNKFDFIKDRVAFFSTRPNGGSRVHKDSCDHRFSINIPIKILDEKCITQWWCDESFEGWEREFDHYSRKLVTKGKKLPPAIKTMIAQPNECLLFNTEMFHSWDNTNSSNPRVILTLRVENPGSMYYDEAKRILFGSIDATACASSDCKSDPSG